MSTSCPPHRARPVAPGPSSRLPHHARSCVAPARRVRSHSSPLRVAPARPARVEQLARSRRIRLARSWCARPAPSRRVRPVTRLTRPFASRLRTPRHASRRCLSLLATTRQRAFLNVVPRRNVSRETFRFLLFAMRCLFSSGKGVGKKIRPLFSVHLRDGSV